MLDVFIKDIEGLYKEIMDGKSPGLVEFKEKWKVSGSIGEVYQNLCKRELKKELGSFYTPCEVVEFMVEEALRGVDLVRDKAIKILDPSCGGGYFLMAVFERLLKRAEGLGLENQEEHLLNNLYGYDIDINGIMITTIELYDRTGCIPRNLKCCDFLLEDEGDFDIVIGNPPYMGHKVLTGPYREKLYSMYKEVFMDKGDISYCFIKKSIDSLKSEGRLFFFTSRYILEALNGKSIRSYILQSGSIKRLVDFYGIRLVKGAGVDNIILEFVKAEEVEQIEFFRFRETAKGRGKAVFEDIETGRGEFTVKIEVNSKNLKDGGWIFLEDAELAVLQKLKGIKLSTVCESYQGIISGCDDAFVVDGEKAQEYEIDKRLLKPWIKSRNIQRFKVLPPKEFIIYSDLITDEKEDYKAVSYIGRYRERLEGRRECRSGARRWFCLQWGRNPLVFEDRKIIFPYKAAQNRFAVDSGCYFSADVYALKIREMFKGSITYEFLVGVLNSSIYEFYIKSMAKKLGEDIYEYYPNKIMTLNIPEYIEEVHDAVMEGEDNLREKVDSILIRHFNISPREYEVIRRWCS